MGSADADYMNQLRYITIAVCFGYFSQTCGTFSETYDGIRENNIEAIFIWQIACTLALSLLTYIRIKLSNRHKMWTSMTVHLLVQFYTCIHCFDF